MKLENGQWTHWGVKAPRKTPEGFSKKEGFWSHEFGIGWSKYQWVLRNGAPMPEDPPQTKSRVGNSFVAATAEKYE